MPNNVISFNRTQQDEIFKNINLQLLTIKDVSTLLVENESTIRTWIRRGYFPANCILKLGGSVRFRAKHLEEWLNNGNLQKE